MDANNLFKYRNALWGLKIQKFVYGLGIIFLLYKTAY